MATVYVTEYRSSGRDLNRNWIQVPQEPANASQTVTSTAGGAQSTAFNDDTGLVRIVASDNVLLHFGSDPQGADAKTLLPASTVEYFAVFPRQKVICKDA